MVNRDRLAARFIIQHRCHLLVPHFEIRLYDNAMLAWIYTEAYRQTEDLALCRHRE